MPPGLAAVPATELSSKNRYTSCPLRSGMQVISSDWLLLVPVWLTNADDWGRFAPSRQFTTPGAGQPSVPSTAYRTGFCVLVGSAFGPCWMMRNEYLPGRIGWNENTMSRPGAVDGS